MTVSGGLAPSSGNDNVTGAFTANGNSSSFTPIPGRGFNISVWGTFSGTVQVQRKMGNDWVAKWPDSVYDITDTARSFIDDEPEHGVEYRLVMSNYASGTANYRISQ